MNLSRRYVLIYLLVALMVLLLSGGCYFSWAKQQENWQELQRLNRRVSAVELQSISRSAELELMLGVLRSTHELPELGLFDPARWLSAIKGVSLASVDRPSVRARVLTDNLVVLDSRAEQSVIVVPIEFDLLVDDRAAGVLAIARYGGAIGTYSSIENCQLQVVQQLNINQGLRLRCRVLKYAIQGVAS